MSHFSLPSVLPVTDDMESINHLVIAAQAGDVDAYGQLVHATQTMAHGVAVGVLRDPAVAQGCRPAGLPESLSSALRFARAGGFPGWLRTGLYCP